MMKILEKIALVVFSIIILILSIVACLLIFGWLDISTITYLMLCALSGELYSNIILTISVVFILLALKCIFFSSDSSENNGSKDSILLENDNGKLLISKDTIENLVNGVVKDFDSAENATTKISLDKENNLRVYVTLSIHKNAIIKDLSANLQLKIKETIKKTSDLDVKEVNIRVKNTTPDEKIEQQ